MAKITGVEVRPGTMIEHQGQLWMAVKSQAVKPGKGGAYNQVELKNIETGSKLNERFRSSEMVEEIHLEKKDFQFLYASGEMLTFMDMETFDQIELAADFVGDQAAFLQDGMKVLVQLHEGRATGIQLPQQVILTVADSGVGIPSAEQSHLFERFFRVDKARSRASGGMGLGLAICHSLVAAQGGTIACQSREHEGSTFEVRLPRK